MVWRGFVRDWGCTWKSNLKKEIMNTLSSLDEFKLLKLPAKTNKQTKNLFRVSGSQNTPSPSDRRYSTNIMALKSTSSGKTYLQFAKCLRLSCCILISPYFLCMAWEELIALSFRGRSFGLRRSSMLAKARRRSTLHKVLC